MKVMPEPSPVLFFVLCAAWVFVLSELTQAQNRTNPVADPAEAKALKTIFQQWKLPYSWNTSDEICSGAAIDSTTIDDQKFNAFIKCDCTFNNNATCRITRMKVYSSDAVGAIPEELWTLTYLTTLDLRENYLEGNLSSSIRNLTRMRYMSFGSNALSGEIPKECGELTELRSLSFATNFFSGSVPKELGNLAKLEQLYLSSSGVSGEIPSTFANLTNLVTVWASDTQLAGRIPDFIGSWSKLSDLRLQGNSFEGPIPAAFSKLTSLTELMLTDLSNGGSSLEFIKDMKSLSTLVLRNNNISTSIPSNIGENQNLEQLDLSFNNIAGQIPNSLFTLGSLTYLFLGNNKLNGTLPAQKSGSLLNIDLSYNNVGGSFPSWVSEPNLLLNIVANNFTTESSTSRALPLGWNCLQRNFPCNRGSGIYYNFSIKCGGPQITTSKGIIYERDNETLGPASYYVSNTNRWAVSNVGYFTGSTNPQYTSSLISEFTNTLDSELYQTARISASSLRYYGLGLENGKYNVSLQFGETAIEGISTWKGLGRRVFDIYIQGNIVLKDFDIRKAAGGIDRRAVQKEFQVQVSENYIEIHLFWAGKGTDNIPRFGFYGPSISAISATPDFIPTVSNKPPSSKKNRAGLFIGLAVGAGVLSFLSYFGVFCIVRRRKPLPTNDDEEFLGMDARPFTFSYAELKVATEDFSPNNKLGEGGFGPVFKGTLNDERVIAVKQLSVTSHQGKNQFITEIATISAVQHRNLVKLYGCCIEGEKRLLVYEFLENKSLDKALFGECSLNLNWSMRYDICMGVARGLAYLHEESRLRIIHRDVKASNILLDTNLVPKISDFGLAKLYDDEKSHITTRVAGTIGYLSPEYAMRGHLTEKADVFAFGVVALEIVSGRRNSDSNLDKDKFYLLEWVWQLHKNNCEVDLVDSRLSEFNQEEVKSVIGVALLCTQASPTLRPSMSRVVAMLSGDIEVGTPTSRPGYLTDWKFDDVTSSMSDGAARLADGSYHNTSASTSTIHNA